MGCATVVGLIHGDTTHERILKGEWVYYIKDSGSRNLSMKVYLNKREFRNP